MSCWTNIYCNNNLAILQQLPKESVSCCITSPPYWGLRDYGTIDQLGREKKLEDYIFNLVKVFSLVKDVLKSDGALFLNLGDCYKNKKQIGIPWRVAIALQDEGWYLRNDIIWYKRNQMPQSCTDRFTTDHEYLFFFTKTPNYIFNQNDVREPCVSFGGASLGKQGDKIAIKKTGSQTRKMTVEDRLKYIAQGRNKRTVWDIPTKSFKDAHFAVFPEKLVEIPILACSNKNDIILDPFGGSGTVGVVANRLSRNCILCENNKEYCDIAFNRIGQSASLYEIYRER